MKVAVFSRHFLPKTLHKKGKKCKGGKKSKQRMTVASVVGGKVDKPIAIWKSKKHVVLNVETPYQNLKASFLFRRCKVMDANRYNRKIALKT